MRTLSTAEVAVSLGLSKSQVSRLAVSGALAHAAKAPGPRGAFLFDPAEVERFAASRREVSA
jgi:hypothetical protein